MPEYVVAAIETDPAALAEDSFEHIAARVPGWEPNPASPETIVLEETAAMAAEVRDVASEVTEDVFRYFGATLAGVPPTVAQSATVTSTWTAPDAAGYTIGEGWLVGVRRSGDELVAFRVQSAVVIPPGQTSTAAGAVTLVSVEESAAANGLGGAGVLAELIESVPQKWVIALTGSTANGADDEDDLSYRNRLSSELALQSPRPILPADFAVLAKRVAEVDRSVAIDLYKPADQPLPGSPAETNRPRSVTVAVVKADGEPVSAGGKTAVRNLLQAMRETTFEVWVIDPSYTTVDVTFAAVAFPGWDTADVQARAIAALQAFLSPKDWGTLPYSDERVWLRETVVRYLEVAEALNRVEGLRYLSSLVIGPSGGPLAASDVALAGVAPLPRAGVVGGTVVAS